MGCVEGDVEVFVGEFEFFFYVVVFVVFGDEVLVGEVGGVEVGVGGVGEVDVEF